MTIRDLPPAYILHNQVTHTRLLPRASKHSFVYPTLSVLVSLNALESNKLDLWRGWLFGFGSTWGRVTGLRASGYLYSDPSDQRSIRSKVVDVLERHGYMGDDLDDTWLMTMPIFLGFEGINPLSVYFCYRRADEALWLVILEVHNTFGERHVYVLDTSKAEHPTSSNFDHQWTFPRQFHVSPFNDRSGHYLCQLTAPSHPPSILFTPNQPPPRPIIKLTLLTPPPHPTNKLIATLRATHSSPLTSHTLLSALIHTPFLLLLTFPRILYQAYILHYHKYLNVYQRPEPCAPDPAIEARLPVLLNAIQPDETDNTTARHGGVGWQNSGPLERWCQKRVYHHLKKQCAATNISVSLIPANPFEKHTTIHLEAHVKPVHTLQIHYRSPQLFTLLFTTPSPMHAIQLGIRADGVFSVSSEDLFTTLFTTSHQQRRWQCLGHLSQHIRRTFLSASQPQTTSPPLPIPPLHALDDPSNPLSLAVLLALILLAVVERTLFGAVGARFVPGNEPWGGWKRFYSGPRPWGKLGSVRREGRSDD